MSPTPIDRLHSTQQHPPVKVYSGTEYYCWPMVSPAESVSNGKDCIFCNTIIEKAGASFLLKSSSTAFGYHPAFYNRKVDESSCSESEGSRSGEEKKVESAFFVFVFVFAGGGGPVDLMIFFRVTFAGCFIKGGGGGCTEEFTEEESTDEELAEDASEDRGVLMLFFEADLPDFDLLCFPTFLPFLPILSSSFFFLMGTPLAISSGGGGSSLTGDVGEAAEEGASEAEDESNAEELSLSLFFFFFPPTGSPPLSILLTASSTSESVQSLSTRTTRICFPFGCCLSLFPSSSTTGASLCPLKVHPLPIVLGSVHCSDADGSFGGG
ncbi:hypothetical protein TYRP_019728 [Tyrophagus putrescentiae]|nr:hypothetical protein TYRP_019728 [Tyrophagus putrescentiae]